MLRIQSLLWALAGATALAAVPAADAGSVYLSGQDPDFHATRTDAAAAAQAQIRTALDFVLDPAANPLVASTGGRFLYVDSASAAPTGHVKGVNGLVASGFTLGTDFDVADASTLNGALLNLGSKYAALVVASDFGGTLGQAELNILNARSVPIIRFLNQGGGIVAFAESNLGAGLTPAGGHFGFLPFVVSSTPLQQSDAGNTVTPFGASLGLTNADVNTGVSHNVFEGTFGLNTVTLDGSGRILTLAGRGEIDNGGVTPEPIPEPLSALLIPLALGGWLLRRRIMPAP